MRSIPAILATLALCGAASAQEELKWHASLDKARETGRPVLLLRILGDLDGKL
jgi:hypothetical protein